MRWQWAVQAACPNKLNSINTEDIKINHWRWWWFESQLTFNLKQNSFQYTRTPILWYFELAIYMSQTHHCHFVLESCSHSAQQQTFDCPFFPFFKSSNNGNGNKTETDTKHKENRRMKWRHNLKLSRPNWTAQICFSTFISFRNQLLRRYNDSEQHWPTLQLLK